MIRTGTRSGSRSGRASAPRPVAGGGVSCRDRYTSRSPSTPPVECIRRRHADRYPHRPQAEVESVQVHRARCRSSSGVPSTDRFQRVLELEKDDFRFDPGYPDLQSNRTDDFALIEILWSAGRSVKVKKKLLGELMASLAGAGLNPENVMVAFKETTWENWSFGGGRLIHT